MALPPLRTELSDTYPDPNNGVFRAGIGKFWDYVTGLLGSTGNAAEARTALGAAADSAVVHDTGDETIAGVKTFSSSPIVPTVASSDNSDKAANTAFVQANKPGAASTSAAGLVELATSAETQAGTDGERAVTPAGLATTVIGMGQSVQNVLPSRAIGTTYYNTTGRSILVSASLIQSAPGNAFLQINGGASYTSGAAASNTISLVGIVPPGQSYAVISGAGTPTLQSWTEMS